MSQLPETMVDLLAMWKEILFRKRKRGIPDVLFNILPTRKLAGAYFSSLYMFQMWKKVLEARRVWA